MHKISGDQAIYSMNADNPPVLTVDPGTEVVFETKDCFSNQITSTEHLFSSVGWATINPATGPLAVKGAEPGDTLVVDILSIKVSSQGSMVCVPDMGALGHLLKETETKIIPVKDGLAVFNDLIKLPIAPMIGVIGTAPINEDIPCGTPGRHGGNMDTRHIGAGTRLYLPVFVAGANLAMGDLHAVMGDGEVSICGVEIPGEVTVKVNLIKGKQFKWPVLETMSDWYLIASGQDLDEAALFAMEEATAFLLSRTQLPVNDVVSLLSIAGNLEISQVVDPLKTVRMRLPKKVFELYRLAF